MSRLFFTEAGSGRPVIFLHGFCDTHELWTDFVKPFTQRYKVILPDLPGFGKSEGLELPFSIDQVADTIVEWMKDQEITRPVVIGHSLGGYVALAMVARIPDNIEAFGLFHSTAFADTPERREVRNKVIEFVKTHGVQPYIDTFVPGLFFDKSNPHVKEVHARASQTKQDALIGFAQAMRDRPDRSPLLTNYEKPKLLIGGVEDSLIAIQTLREQAKKAKNAQYFELAKVAHMGLFEAETECKRIITRFTDTVFSNKLN